MCVLMPQFLARGYKVGRVDQCEDAATLDLDEHAGQSADTGQGRAQGKAKRMSKSKGKAGRAASGAGESVIRRELKVVLTNGTLVDSALLQDDTATHCISLKVCVGCTVFARPRELPLRADLYMEALTGTHALGLVGSYVRRLHTRCRNCRVSAALLSRRRRSNPSRDSYPPAQSERARS